MMESLDLHLLDLFQNALGSGATEIAVRLACRSDEGRLDLEVRDNGSGMDEETLTAVERGYFSSKCERCVGLGIPLLRATAERCGGELRIDSRPGVGTRVTASFELHHLDLPPFGDLVETFLTLLCTTAGRRIQIEVECDGTFAIDTAVLEQELDGVPRTHPEVIEFLRRVLREAPVLKKLQDAAGNLGIGALDQGIIAGTGPAAKAGP